MKKDWKYKKLGEVCEVFCDGDWIESKDQSEDGIRLIQTGNVGNGVYRDKADKSKYISEETFKQLNCTEIFPGDILVSRLPDPIGRACIIPETGSRMITAVDCSIIRLKECINSNLFVYYTRSDSYSKNIDKFTTGTTRKRISRSNLALVSVPIPPKDEQQQIVAELDLLNGMIEKQKAQIEELNKLAQSIFYDMFGDPVTNEKGWEVKKLKEICSKITDGTHNSPTNDAYGAYMYITAKNIKESGLSLDNITYVSEEVHRSIYERCNPVYGDVLYIKDGATTGIAVVNNLKEEFSLLSSVALLKPGPQLVNQYLKAVLNNPSEYKCIRSNMGGAAITRLTIKKIEGIEIPLPPLSLQQEFAAKIEAIEAMKAKARQSLKEAETLFNSRMDYYFN